MNLKTHILSQVRSFSLWLNSITCRWVVPHSIWQDIDRNPDDPSIVQKLNDIELNGFYLDPEIVRARLLIRRECVRVARNKPGGYCRDRE